MAIQEFRQAMKALTLLLVVVELIVSLREMLR